MTLQETVSKIFNREVSLDKAKDFAHGQFGALTTWLRENPVISVRRQHEYLENNIDKTLRDLISKSKIESKHISDCKVIEVNLYGFTELAIINEKLTFMCDNGLHYSVNADATIDDLINIIEDTKNI